MKDKVHQVSTIILWVIAIYLWASKNWWYLAVGIFALHFVELFVKGIKVGKKAQKSSICSIIMTLIFGISWWLPLQKNLNK